MTIPAMTSNQASKPNVSGRAEHQLDMFLDEPAILSASPAKASSALAGGAQPLVRGPVEHASTPAIERSSEPKLVTENQSKIVDAGEELAANRRNRLKRGIAWADIESLNEAMRVKETVKNNVWPKPDYAQMIADGMQPMVAHIYKQVYDSIAAKPVTRGAFTEDVLKMYIQGVQEVEQGLSAWSQDKAALRAWAMQNARFSGSMLGQVWDTSGHDKSLSLLETTYPNGWRESQVALRAIGANKVLGALQPGYQEVKRAIKAIDEGWPTKREAWEVQGYKVIDRPAIEISPTPSGGKFVLMAGRHYLSIHPDKAAAQAAAAEVKAVLLLGKRGVLASFEQRDDAIEHAKTLVRKVKSGASQDIDFGSNVAEADRVGTHRRMEGEDISSERLMEEFGLRGVNLGNWMKAPSARAEAQLHLNHAFDAFHDLAEILDVPPKAIGLGGILGLAIGAQGRGGNAAGHFVPGVNEINLTRTTGAGVLSHEYAHAIDHYFAQQASLSATDEPFLSSHARLPQSFKVREVRDGKSVYTDKPRFGEVRPEILNSFKKVVEVMLKRPLTPDEVKARSGDALQRAEKMVASWLASFARDFKEVEKDFAVLAERVKQGDLGGQKKLVGQSTYVYPVVAEMRDLYKAKHGRLYSLEQVKGLQSCLDSLVYQKEIQANKQSLEGKAGLEILVSTNYANAAAALDNDKGGKPYWATVPELFARAFDTYIADRLDSISAKNTYLSFGVRETPDVPCGDERKVINAAFNVLVGELRVKEQDLAPPALFSVGASANQCLSPQIIEAEIERLRGQWKGMPPVHVVDTHQELPFNSPADADGAYHDGQVYLISSNIGDLQQLHKVMAHECVMHHSLEQMLGNYGFAKLHHGIQSLKAKGDATITELATNIHSRYGELPPEMETKEIVARAGEMCLDKQGNVKVEYGFMKGVFAGVAGWIRDNGISVPFTNMELQGILHNSGEWAKNGSDIEASQSKTAVGKLKALTGLFIGRIVDIDKGVVTQKVGRGEETVLHSMSNLSTGVKLGQLAEILYRGEKAEVKVQAQSHDMGR